MIHQLLEDAKVFEDVCKYLGTDLTYYSSPEELSRDFSLREISLALNDIVGWEDFE